MVCILMTLKLQSGRANNMLPAQQCLLTGWSMDHCLTIAWGEGRLEGRSTDWLKMQGMEPILNKWIPKNLGGGNREDTGILISF